MAYGIRTPNAMPTGRKPFGASVTESVASPRIVRPGAYADGQTREGTTANQAHRTNSAYKAGESYRRDLGGQPYGGTNPSVTSKGDRLTGKNATHGEQPASLYRDPSAPSAANKSVTQRARPAVEQVGHATDGSGRFHRANFPNRGKHGLDGYHDPRASTDGAQGQAYSASGGAHGKPSRASGRKVESRPGDHGIQPARTIPPSR